MIKNYFNYNPKLGISFLSFNKLKKFTQKQYKDTTVPFLGKNFTFSNPFWFLHSLEEIFVDEVYKFEPSKDKMLILDCGANVGLSVVYLKNQFPNAEIIAFEPDRKVFSQLKSNIENFGFQDVKLVNAATWINEGKLNFAAEGSVGGRISDIQEVISNEVDAVRLRDYIANNKVFFLKIDIEGAEYDVLKDCKDVLGNVENLFIEFHNRNNEDNTLDEILTWAREAGFTTYIKEAWNNMPFPFTKKDIGGYHLQLNIFCYRNEK